MNDLLERALDGMLEAGEEERLAMMLRDPGAVTRYLEMARLEALLSETVVSVPVSETPSRFGRWIPMAAALLMFGLAVWMTFAPAKQEDPALARLIEKLSAPDIESREQAGAEIMKLGEKGLRALEAAKTTDPELKMRIADLMDRMTRPSLVPVAELDFDGWFYIFDTWWTPDGGRYCVSGKVFDTATMKRDPALEKIGAAAISADGRRMLKEDKEGVRIFPVDTPDGGARIDGKLFMGPTRFLGKDRIVFVGEYTQTIRSGGGGSSTGPASAIMVAGAKDGVWKVEKELRLGGNVYEVSLDGRWLAAGIEHKVFDTTTWAEVADLDGEARFSPDCKTVLVGQSSGKQLSLFSTDGWKPLWQKSVDPAPGNSWITCFSQDSMYALFVGTDRTVRIIRCADGIEIGATKVWGNPSIMSASPAGDWVMIGCNDPEAKRWTDATRRKLLVYKLTRP